MEGFAKTFTEIMEKLAGKESDLELIFSNLALEIGGMKATLNGKVSFDIKYNVKA